MRSSTLLQFPVLTVTWRQQARPWMFTFRASTVENVTMKTCDTTGITDEAAACGQAANQFAAARFWDGVQMGSADDCWPWVGRHGSHDASGHVRIWFNGTKQYCHRIAYTLGGGELLEGDLCLHSCDRPDCCNPNHCRPGTAQDNVDDRERRNRRTPFLPRGGAHWSAKLSDADALRVRAARALGLPARHVAALYGISRSTVYAIWSGEHYPVADTEGSSSPAEL